MFGARPEYAEWFALSHKASNHSIMSNVGLQNMSPRLSIWPLALLLLSVAGPSALAQEAPQVEKKPKPPVRGASLLPGCLLPESTLIADGAPFNAALSLSISTEGRVEAAKITQTTGTPELDSAFTEAASQCLFQAATQDGVPVNYSYTLRFRWTTKTKPQGLSLCFMPDYSRAAIHSDAEGTVEVAFRRRDGSTEPEVRIVKGATPRALNVDSVRTAQACLQHPVVRDSLLPNAWYSQTITWQLEY